METPLSSTKRITRSQTKAAAAAAAATMNNSVSMSRRNEQVSSESKQRNNNNNNGGKSDRSALIDITNDSPIVGLAMGGSLKTPSSFSKKKDLPRMRMITTTPGSGEALLRREVKTLLQKVEEEAAADQGSKLSFDRSSSSSSSLFHHLEDPSSSSSSSLSGVLRLQAQAMMMINNNSTPHLFFPSKSNGAAGDDMNIKGNSLKPSPPQVEAEFKIPPPQVVERRIDGGLKQESFESEKSLITRSLLFDFSEKTSSSESSYSSSICSSVGSVSQVLESDEEDNGVWSIRVNNNKTTSKIQSKEEEEEEEEEEYYEEDESEGGGGVMIDELCEGVMKISVVNEFEGKHTRFVYNSEDEIEGEEEDVVVVVGMRTRRRRRKSSLHLKGLPTPAGKHLRFSNEEEEEDIL